MKDKDVGADVELKLEDTTMEDEDVELKLEDTRLPSDAAHDRKRTMTCRRRMSMCVILFLMVVCGAIAGVVVYQQKIMSNSTVSGIQDNGGGGNRTCNGLATNCQRRVNEIMYATVHNAYSALDDNFVVAYNNIYSLEDALEAGFRAMLLDTCLCTGGYAALCHSTCGIGFRSIVKTFEAIRDFMNNNRNEVVIIELQVGAESFQPFYEELVKVEGLTELMYQHLNLSTPWPLISELVENNTRLIMFQHDGPDCDVGECPPGFHNTFTYMFETPFNASGFEGLMDFNATCVRSRGKYLITASFMISNHYGGEPPLGLPDESIAEEANLAENIRNRTDACTKMLNRSTNLLVVDFWNIGDTLEVVQDYNSLLPEITPSPSMSPSPSASPTRNPNTSSQSMTEEPSALPTSQPTGQPTDQPTGQPTGQPIEFTATPSVISSAADTTVISSVTEMPTALDENSASVPVSESSSSVPSSAAQVYSTVAPTLSIESTPGPSPNEVTGTKSPTLSPTYSLKDYTS